VEGCEETDGGGRKEMKGDECGEYGEWGEYGE